MGIGHSDQAHRSRISIGARNATFSKDSPNLLSFVTDVVHRATEPREKMVGEKAVDLSSEPIVARPADAVDPERSPEALVDDVFHRLVFLKSAKDANHRSDLLLEAQLGVAGFLA
jgi:hypothetical protein